MVHGWIELGWCPFGMLKRRSLPSFHPDMSKINPEKVWECACHTDPGFMNHQGNGRVSCFAIIQKAEESLYGLRGIIFAEQMYTHILKLAQHTTPIAKTHRTATLFSSEPTENLKMFISIHHRNITISSRSPQHHHPSLRHHSITDTEQRHHQHKTKASPTYHQNITTQSLHITETRPRHHRHII